MTDKSNFYNPLIIRNKENYKRFSVVPFSASEVKKIVTDSTYNLLDSITNKEDFEQVTFGVKGCMEFVRDRNIETSFVSE